MLFHKQTWIRVLNEEWDGPVVLRQVLPGQVILIEELEHMPARKVRLHERPARATRLQGVEHVWLLPVCRGYLPHMFSVLAYRTSFIRTLKKIRCKFNCSEMP